MNYQINKCKHGKGLHIAHLNVRSILGINRFDMLLNQIESSEISIFTMSETWLTEAIPDKYVSVDQYDVIRLNRGWSSNETGCTIKKGGGLACYVKKGLRYSDTKYHHLNVSCSDLEMLIFLT